VFSSPNLTSGHFPKALVSSAFHATVVRRKVMTKDHTIVLEPV